MWSFQIVCVCSLGLYPFLVILWREQKPFLQQHIGTLFLAVNILFTSRFSHKDLMHKKSTLQRMMI
uniref:Uncharacterized protein MANES_17G112100 n=1 Tax=Rhizophora mucronata TaxID=61149 RepID=A0A2P2KNW0_RHIMU